MNGLESTIQQWSSTLTHISSTSQSTAPINYATYAPATNTLASATNTSASAPTNLSSSTNLNTSALTYFPTSTDDLLSGEDVESIIGSVTSPTHSTSSFHLSHPPITTPSHLHHGQHSNAPIQHSNPPSPPPSTFSAPPVTPPRSYYHAQPFPPHQTDPFHQPSRRAATLQSPERITSSVTGRETRSLRILSVKLARECFFGDALMASASPSGKGGPGQRLVQLDPQLMLQIRVIIRQRARFLSEGEFEGLWQNAS